MYKVIYSIHKLHIYVYIYIYIHARWWSPDFWTINRIFSLSGCSTTTLLETWRTPPKFNSSPLKNGGKGRLLSYWALVNFQGRTVKLREGRGRLKKTKGEHLPVESSLRQQRQAGVYSAAMFFQASSVEWVNDKLSNRNVEPWHAMKDHSSHGILISWLITIPEFEYNGLGSEWQIEQWKNTGPWLFDVFFGMKYCTVIWGLFHRPFQDPY